MVARDIMSRPVASVLEDVPVREAARVMADRGVSGLAVLDRKGRLVGVIRASDIVRYETTREALSMSEIDHRRAKAGREFPDGLGARLTRLNDETVKDIMTLAVTTASASATLSQLAHRMSEQRVHRVFIEEGGRLAGVVTAFDITRHLGQAFARSSNPGDP